MNNTLNTKYNFEDIYKIYQVKKDTLKRFNISLKSKGISVFDGFWLELHMLSRREQQIIQKLKKQGPYFKSIIKYYKDIKKMGSKQHRELINKWYNEFIECEKHYREIAFKVKQILKNKGS